MVKTNWKRLFFWIAAVIFILDRITKYFVVMHKPVIELLPFLELHYATNTGISFGLLQDYPFIPLIVAAGVAIGILYHYNRIPHTYLTQIGGSLIFAGTLGNLLDRLFYGSVVDFIAVGTFPAFNIADSAITMGAGLVIVYLIKEKK